jgi:hypothetical protein
MAHLLLPRHTKSTLRQNQKNHFLPPTVSLPISDRNIKPNERKKTIRFTERI